MSAVQLMSGRGGWPLNCICLPDQRPIYGGTYFRKNDWASLLFNLADFYTQKPTEANEYAVRLTEGIQNYETIAFVKEQPEYTEDDLLQIVNNWKQYFDREEGGMGSSPKFPMPNNWQFLMRYAYLMNDSDVAQVVTLTLKKMAFGGIYDHIGGGFARYSVDGRWHVPHFEKMLYDNAQLISLYSEANTFKNSALYKQVVDDIIAFTLRELRASNSGFYSALDADSEGVEGKFYTFTKAEIEAIVGDEAELFCIYYNITDEGNWEEENTNVLYRKEKDLQLANKLGLPLETLVEKIEAARKKVFNTRAQRIRPGLDNKILASWNGLMLKGLCDAFRAFNENEHLELAIKTAEFVLNNMINADGRLSRIYKGKDNDNIAFLDDYANVIDGLIALYEVTFNEKWLGHAIELADYSIMHYYDPANGIFYFTADDEEQLIARKSEIMDGVIPSSNSVMGRVLKKLGLLYDDEEYLEISAQLLRNVTPQMAKYGSAYSNWCMLLLDEVFGTYEVAITGSNYEAKRVEIENNYIPNKIILGGTKGSLPLLTDKFGEETQIFICKDKTCSLPVHNTTDALKQINANILL